ncbi:MAG: potassium-transporting ATPase subunit KdpC [Acidobacteria bacterium]|nr:potassium-transporting ATPase subunit KdpC [Acidobacteriota bacterium]
MWKDIVDQLKTATLLLLALTALTGLLYPLMVTGVAQTLCPDRANGSLVLRDGAVRGSRLVGQSFRAPGYFRGRPSATTPACNAAASAGSNLGPSDPERLRRAAAVLEALRGAGPRGASPVPVDLVTASGSGLDPDISPAAAEYQVPRVARARGIDPGRLRELVRRRVVPPQYGILGDARVNVLELNLALDRLTRAEDPGPGLTP